MCKLRAWILLSWLFIVPLALYAESPTHQKICLNMIVKNEKDVIERCLNSMLPMIDYWVIVDTGSTDGTQDIIKNFMKAKNMPGELHERPWINFGHNRNEALQLAKGKADYTFFIDADEYLKYEPGFKIPVLDKDFYYVNVSFGGCKYARVLCINDKLDWKWIGVLHEAVCCDSAQTCGTLENVYDFVTAEGARSKDPDKFLRDVATLQKGLIDEPENTRYQFYLAQSYSDAGNREESIKQYEKRIEMGGWDQELFWSAYKIAEMKKALGKPKDECIAAYSRAFNFRKCRVEPLYGIANIFREKEDYQSGYNVAKLALSMPQTDDLLFVQQWMYDWGLELELSICAYWTGKYQESKKVCEQLLAKPNLLQSVKECVTRNLEFANSKILEELISPNLVEN